MAYTEKVGGSLDRIEMDALPKKNQIQKYVRDCIDASKFFYHESEEFYVTNVIHNEVGDRGSVRGYFVNKPGEVSRNVDLVKPLWPNIVTIPVVGERVVAIEYGGQFYYTSIINKTDFINENSVVDSRDFELKKLGDTFERRNVPQIEINEGSVAYEGRYGQSIHFDRNIDGDDISPVIKIRANHQQKIGLVSEDIDNDDSSIYLTSNGLLGKTFNGNSILGKKVLIKSNGIFINGRDEVLIDTNLGKDKKIDLTTSTVNLNSDEVNIGNGAKQPVIRGDDLVTFLDTFLNQLDIAALAFKVDSVGGAALTTAVKTLKGILDLSTMKSKTTKTV